MTPVKNPSTTGSAGRSDPARDASSDPRAFHLLFFHTFHHFWFLGNHSPGGKVESWRILRLRWRLFSGVGLFSFLSAKLGPVWPKPAPDRAGAGRFPHPGVGNRHTGPSWGAKRGPWVVFVGRLTVGGPPVPEGTQGDAKIPLEGGDGIGVTCQGFPKGARRQCVPVYSSAYTQYVGDLIFPKHKMRKCTPCPFAPLHPSFFSQPIPLVG